MDTKVCQKCEIEKQTDEFDLNAARLDGFNSVCKNCKKISEPTYIKRSLKNVTKECLQCKRSLSRAMFRYCQTTEDRLTDWCRTCSMFRKGSPSLAEVEELETRLDCIIESAKSRFDPTTHRTQFEEYVYKQMYQSNLLDAWKPPIWLNKKIL